MIDKELLEAIGALSGDNGWVVQVLAWMASARIVFKLVSQRLQTLMERMIARVTGTDEDDDDALANRLLGSAPWKLFAFLVDMICSVKLPTGLK